MIFMEVKGLSLSISIKNLKSWYSTLLWTVVTVNCTFEDCGNMEGESQAQQRVILL